MTRIILLSSLALSIAGKLTALKWRMFGKPKSVQAAEAGVPFEKRRFWPAYYCFGNKEPPKAWTVNKAICPELYASKVGDVVPVFVTSDGAQALYKVLGFSWASGDDHIVSPRQFHIQFEALSNRGEHND